MFTDQFVPLHVKRVALKTEKRQGEEVFPVFSVGLSLEPFTYEHARQLGGEVLGHCFTNRQTIREQMAEVTVDVADPEQCLIARMAADVPEHARLRHVRIRKITITKRDLSADDGKKRKAKKIGPRQATLVAVLSCLVDSAEKSHRDFLCGLFAKTMYFTFEPEQENLFTGVHTAGNGDAAGDVLDEQRKLSDGAGGEGSA